MSQTPGKSFRKAITMAELFGMFPDNQTAMKWFEARIWRGIRKCPKCRSDRTSISAHKTMPYRCRDCKQFFSVKFGTVMEHSRISYQNWAIGTYLFAVNLKGVSSMKLHRDLGIGQKAAWFMVHRLRESWKQLVGVNDMEGPVEIDEVYLGGLEKNKHIENKHKKEKVTVVGIRDRATNRTSAQPIPETTKPRLEHSVYSHANKDAKKYTDESPSYHGLTNHESVKHSVDEYVREQAHVNGMESFWAMVRRGYDGTFHHVSEQHLHRYVNEFTGRHNVRGYNTIGIMGLVVENMEVGLRMLTLQRDMGGK